MRRPDTRCSPGSTTRRRSSTTSWELNDVVELGADFHPEAAERTATEIAAEAVRETMRRVAAPAEIVELRGRHE